MVARRAKEERKLKYAQKREKSLGKSEGVGVSVSSTAQQVPPTAPNDFPVEAFQSFQGNASSTATTEATGELEDYNNYIYDSTEFM